jgi:hypothetical protein
VNAAKIISYLSDRESAIELNLDIRKRRVSEIESKLIEEAEAEIYRIKQAKEYKTLMKPDRFLELLRAEDYEKIEVECKDEIFARTHKIDTNKERLAMFKYLRSVTSCNEKLDNYDYDGQQLIFNGNLFACYTDGKVDIEREITPLDATYKQILHEYMNCDEHFSKKCIKLNIDELINFKNYYKAKLAPYIIYVLYKGMRVRLHYDSFLALAKTITNPVLYVHTHMPTAKDGSYKEGVIACIKGDNGIGVLLGIRGDLNESESERYNDKKYKGLYEFDFEEAQIESPLKGVAIC